MNLKHLAEHLQQLFSVAVLITNQEDKDSEIPFRPTSQE